MTVLKLFLAPAAFAILLAVPAFADTFDLNYDRLERAIDVLSHDDRDAVNDSIQLIKDGKHSLALARLSALNKSNPKNSSLRILASYALLQAGNVVGAFKEAETAHEAPNGNSYKCWFLGKVALLNGKGALCEREIEHVHGVGDMVAEAKALEAELAKN